MADKKSPKGQRRQARKAAGSNPGFRGRGKTGVASRRSSAGGGRGG